VRPLLFLDVDGVLIPFGASSEELPGGYPVHPPEIPGNPLLSRIDPALGDQLQALPCEVVWATTWLEEANDLVAPRLGLSPRPFVDFSDDSDVPPALHWKTPALVAWAAGRAFAWVDDELGDRDRAWVAAHHSAPTLLHRVDPRHGMTRSDLTALRVWLEGIRD
jgi:HAD domain in Swiss Army Knife RNA repair proteins